VGILGPRGRWFCLEVKSDTGRTTEEQQRWAAMVRSMGGFAAIVRTPEEAREALERARAAASE
jgi:thiamine pyrophosphate-dependent acetolactate synthase large subunit-like protein